MVTIKVYQAIGCMPYEEGDLLPEGIIVKAICLGEVENPHPHSGGELEWELEIERPCQCGSGQSWSTCSKNTSYCG